MTKTQHSIVVGAGIVGLSVAWYLQERGHQVTVLDRDGVAAGSSWGNAGWLSPGKTIPLANAGLWAYTPQALLDKDAALHVPIRFDPKLWDFGIRFMAQANNKAWDKTMAKLTPIDLVALAGFDEMVEGGVESWTKAAPFIVAFKNDDEAAGFIEEVEGAVRHGQDVPFRRVDRSVEPLLSGNAQVVYELGNQRFFEPGPFVRALGDNVEARGGEIVTGAEVVQVSSTRIPVVTMSTGERHSADNVVVATGAWLPKLTRHLGVRTRVQAGRGYSFSVETEHPVTQPIYLPAQRLACTPYQGRFRIAGTMEFKHPDEPFDPRRIESMVAHASEMFTGVDLHNRQDEWVGSRPVTPDGLPLIGATTAPNVYVAGGHGMWGVILGPASGKALAHLIDTGETVDYIKDFDPLR